MLAAARVRHGQQAARRAGLAPRQQPWLVARTRPLCSMPRLLSDEVEPAGDAQGAWAPGSLRCGSLAGKCGMMSLFDGYGVRRGVTVMMLDDVQVTQVKSPEHGDEVTALQVGIGVKRAHRAPKSVRGHFESNDLNVKQKTGQFTVTPDALMPVGTRITARHFVPGQFVDVQVRACTASARLAAASVCSS